MQRRPNLVGVGGFFLEKKSFQKSLPSERTWDSCHPVPGLGLVLAYSFPGTSSNVSEQVGLLGETQAYT